MSDITIYWDTAYSRGDFALTGQALDMGLELQTSILISLFSDRMANVGDVIPAGTDPRGWWADDAIGSRLWLLSRAKQTQETLQRAYDYIVEAIQWLIDDGVVARFDVMCQWVRASFLGAQIVAYKQDGTQLMTGKYVYAWNGTI